MVMFDFRQSEVSFHLLYKYKYKWLYQARVESKGRVLVSNVTFCFHNTNKSWFHIQDWLLLWIMSLRMTVKAHVV